jgi:hypothetical protein
MAARSFSMLPLLSFLVGRLTHLPSLRVTWEGKGESMSLGRRGSGLPFTQSLAASQPIPPTMSPAG